MDKNEAICVLGKMHSMLAKKPSWYESVSAEDKAKHDEWATQRAEAIDIAIRTMKAETKLLRLQTMSHEISGFIDKLIAGELDNEEQD